MSNPKKVISRGGEHDIGSELSADMADSDRAVAEQLVVHGLLQDATFETQQVIDDRIEQLIERIERDDPAPHGISASLMIRPVAAAVLAASIVVAMVFMPRPAASDRPIASLLVHDIGVILIGDAKESSVEVGTSIDLRSGQTIRTSYPLDSAEVQFSDGTVIQLASETQVTINEASDQVKQVNVHSGQIQADVAPQQRGKPLRVLTPTATLEVLGTTLGVDVGESSTQLEVASGMVSMTRHADGKSVKVAAGQRATATGSSRTPLEVQTFPKLPDTWSVSFETGLPRGWWAGKLIETERGPAVLAAGDGRGQENNIAVTTQNAWREGQHGLFTLHGDSVLHVRFRQEQPAPLRLMLTTRAYPPNNGKSGVNLYYEDDSWNAGIEPGMWHTVSVPLSEAAYHGKRKQYQEGAPELSGLAVFIVQLSSMDDDIGLTVDRFWVTR